MYVLLVLKNKKGWETVIMNILSVEANMLVYKEFGNIVGKSYYSKLASLMKDIEEGDASAMEDLAILYEYGADEYGISKDPNKRAYWFYQAAKHGSVKGAYYYGNHLVSCSDDGRLKDVEAKGIYYMKIAADKGMARAQQMVGIAYFNGWGVEISYNLAYKYLSLAVAGGAEGAQEDLDILISKMNGR